MKKKIIYLFVGTALLTVSCTTGRVVQMTASHIPVDQRADAIQNKEMAAFIEPYEKIVDKTANAVVGYTDQDLTPGKPEGTLGNFFADVMLDYARQHSAKPVDLAVQNPGGMRKPILKGAIKVFNIFELAPFENTLVVLDLQGNHVQALADSIAAYGGGPVAGIRFGIKNGRAVNVQVGGQPLDMNKIYRVAANDYMAKGNDFYQALTKATAIETMPLSLRDILMERVKQETAKGNHIHATLEGRIYEDKE